MPKRPANRRTGYPAHDVARAASATAIGTASAATGATGRRPTNAARVAGNARIALLAVVAIAAAVGAWAWTRHLPAEGDVRDALAKGQYTRAAAWLAEEAAAGDPAARTALANLHYLGLGVPRDARRAAELYFAAASEGHSPAQVNLAHLYGQGLGVPLDAIRAFGWYHHADLADEPIAENYLYQIGVEYTLSPLQRATAVERWHRLEALVAEGL